MKQKLIIKLSDGTEVDWFTISRKERRNIMKKIPGLKTKIDSAIAEIEAEKDKPGAEF